MRELFCGKALVGLNFVVAVRQAQKGCPEKELSR